MLVECAKKLHTKGVVYRKRSFTHMFCAFRRNSFDILLFLQFGYIMQARKNTWES